MSATEHAVLALIVFLGLLAMGGIIQMFQKRPDAKGKHAASTDGGGGGGAYDPFPSGPKDPHSKASDDVGSHGGFTDGGFGDAGGGGGD